MREVYAELKFTCKASSDLYGGSLKRATKDSAGYDLYCVDFNAYSRHLVINTGIHLWLKANNVVALVIPRSSNTIKLINTIGVIDSDYQGEIIIKAENDATWTEDNLIGTRIAQLLIIPIYYPKIKVVSEFSEVTERGNNGFGSTGL